MSNFNILAIIPARGGSKRLPRKNILPLLGMPLLTYSIHAAKHCPLITSVIVSSEDTEICNLASNMDVQVIRRPKHLALDTVSNEHVLEHAIHHYTQNHAFPDYVVLLQPTSPLRHTSHLTECLKNFLASEMKSTMSVCLANHHPAKYVQIMNDAIVPYTTLEDVEKRIQELPLIYRQNGAIYALKTSDFLNTLTFYQPPCLPYIMSIEESIDIDSQFDLDYCEFLLKHNKLPQLRGIERVSSV